MNKPELLIIDDEESIHQVLNQYLTGLGFVSHSAHDGAEGLQMLERNPAIELVLTDIRIPGVDGLDVLRQVKLRDPKTRVILMTAFSDKNLAIQALRLGADDYLEKPFRLEELSQIIDRVLNRGRLRSISIRWKHFLEHLPLGFVWCDSEGSIQAVTPTAARMLHLRENEIRGQKVWTVHGLAAARKLFRQRGSDEPATSVDIELFERWLVLQRADLRSDLEPGTAVILLTDASEQRQLNKELGQLSAELESRVEERTRSLSAELDFSQRLLDAASVVIAYQDPDGRLVRFNNFAQELTGFTRAEAEATFLKLARGNLPTSVIFDPKRPDEVSDVVAEFPTVTGSARTLSWTTRRLTGRTGHGGKLIVGIDVTEQKQLEATLHNYNTLLQNMVETRSKELRLKDAQLIHSARLASLGEIAAGIAHEMKQPLNVISITADLIKLLHRNGTLNDDLLVSNLEKIRRTVEKMAVTINHLRGFTRIDTANFRAVKVSEVIDGALTIVGEQIKLDGIDIHKDFPQDMPLLLCEAQQIEQVLVNLMQNARDAILDKAANSAQPGDAVAGTITVAAGCSKDRSEVFIDVKDTGTGMSEEVLQRLFEPFFTTKDPESGTGLGLSISMNIVQSHGGVMEVDSVEGQGSSFRVILPAVPATEETQSAV